MTKGETVCGAAGRTCTTVIVFASPNSKVDNIKTFISIFSVAVSFLIDPSSNPSLHTQQSPTFASTKSSDSTFSTMGYPETATGFVVKDPKQYVLSLPDKKTLIDLSHRWQSFHKEEFKLKTFEEDDVDIAIDACGVCGSDVHCTTSDML